ncbi:MAG: HEAT repeat domain-containing protein [Betaproteobacteria bacterium]|nr:HEAT repeat domain-containing protein [Betaproteobacteria bacterium]
MSQNSTPAPDVLLLLAPDCPYCPAMLESLAGLLKEGVIGRLEAVNVAIHPERAAELGTRTVPWVKIGPFELEGALTPGELRRWAEQADNLDGMADYFFRMLKNGRRAKVEEMARQAPLRLQALVHLMKNPDTSMAVRIGIGAVLEELHGSGLTEAIIPDLGALTRDGDALTRADACHFLSLIGGPEVASYLRASLDDENKEVREIASESLEELGLK